MKKYIIGVLALAIAGTAGASIKDSIGQKVIDGKKYVMYKVDAKETLYSLSKTYNTSVEAIKSANNGLTSGLQKGSTVLIPSSSSSNSIKVAGVKVANVVQAIHIVGDDETLYSISKKYNVTVEEIKKWNDLKDNSISKGQELNVSKPVNQIGDIVVKPVNALDGAVIKTDQYTKVDPDQSFTQIAPPINSEPVVDTKRGTEYAIDSSLYGEEVTEVKTISKIGQMGVDQSKNLAQMAGIKVGTILMIVNPANNKATFVRVVSGNSEEEIQVTSSVLNALELNSSSASKVKVSYTK